jgi:hypothetical protein
VRTPVDALLSVRRWVASVLPGPPWRVLLAADPGRVERPYAIVAPADGATGQHDGPAAVRETLPLVVHAFPDVGSRPSGSALIAQRVASALDWAVRAGVPDRGAPAVRGFKQRIPLWDYGGVNPDALDSEDALDSSAFVPTRTPHDYLLVADGWKANVQPEADEGQLFVATLELRVQWFSPTGLRSVGTELVGLRTDIRP